MGQNGAETNGPFRNMALQEGLYTNLHDRQS